MEVTSLLALNAGHRAIGDALVGLSVQRYPNRKAARRAISDDLNATNGLAARPLPYGLKAFFAERPIVQTDRFEFPIRNNFGTESAFVAPRGYNGPLTLALRRSPEQRDGLCALGVDRSGNANQVPGTLASALSVFSAMSLRARSSLAVAEAQVGARSSLERSED
jgi:hypothetical protein